MKPNPIDVWLATVAYSHSSSKNTRYSYKKNMDDYCRFAETNPEKILAEYEIADERTFKRKHANQILQWITKLHNENFAPSTIRSKIGAVKSFYKYNSLSLGFIPQAKERILYHNRDIDANEIAQIIQLSKLREKAIYALMAQSGLRPCVVQKLRLGMIENLDEEQESYLIQVPEEIEKGKFASHPAFMGKEARKYLKMYLATRKDELIPDSLLFITHRKPKREINTKNLSRAFQYTARKLKKTGHMAYKIRGSGKPSEIRLYNLRKFFKKYAYQMGEENVNYLMGHTIVGSNANYKAKDPEHYRKIYEEKALPNLKLEEAKPADLYKLKQEHQEEIAELRTQVATVTNKLAKKDTEIQELKQLILPLTELMKLVDKYGIVDLVVKKRTQEQLEAEQKVLNEMVEEHEKRSKAKKPQE